MHYSDKVDKALGTSYSKHRTLRTCFDPGSTEWTETNMKERIEVLRTLLKDGNDLDFLLMEYKMYYKSINKPHVANRVEDGLIELLKYLLKQ